MEWVAEFYARQDQLLGLYTGPSSANDRERAAAIERLAGAGAKRILELGAAGGQSAAAMADLGHNVVAVELVPTAAQHAQRLAAQPRSGSLCVIQGDFYQIDLPGPFDVVCYWDGFGVGTDADQQRLLARIAAWLAPSGCALIDINTPWYWAHAAGREMRFETAIRRYDFDAEGCRVLDCWWSPHDEGQAVTQSLRCYSPADLRLLLAGSGLRVQAIEPGGAMDYEAGRYTPRVPLAQAMQYLAILVLA